MERHGVDMKKAIVLLILLAACKQTETTNETTTTMTATESSATVATVAPTPPAALPATSAIETMGTNPAAKSQRPEREAHPLVDDSQLDLRSKPPSPTLASAGSAVFKSQGCDLCHGTSGAGDTAIGKKNKIQDFRSAAVQSQSDASLAKTIREGKGPVSASIHKSMGLTSDQAAAVVAWIRTLK
jgi:mono/diheme cytochrome c family protein